jgi:VCBS repeat-containing protein
VTPNTAPVANGDSYSTPYVTTLNVAAAGVLGNDTDANGDALTAVLVAGPTNGSLTLNANGSFSYTPNSGFSGNDTFTYKASDGALQSNTATVTITVGAQPKLVGNITLNDFNPGPNGIAIDVEIRDHTTQVVEFTLSGTLDASGNYSINLVPPVLTGNHDVAIKASHWLRKNVANVSFSGVTATANATLTNGDVDNDNVVSIFDYVRMSLSFDLSVGDAGFDPAADLDGDGTVSIFDYIILSTHFDEQGD